MRNMEEIIKTKNWIEKMVIAHKLCPFAQLPFEKNKISYRVSKELNTENQIMDFWKELIFLENSGSEKLSNSLVVYSDPEMNFDKYLDLYFLAEQLLISENKDGDFQLASFHPEYQFDGTEKNDVTNFTNRSPFPMIHILRINEVEMAIENHPNIDEVPENNERKMNELGMEKIKRILSELK